MTSFPPAKKTKLNYCKKGSAKIQRDDFGRQKATGRGSAAALFPRIE
jgi:hypothetical protein